MLIMDVLRDNISDASSSSAPPPDLKTAIVNNIRSDYAVDNARQLLEVRIRPRSLSAQGDSKLSVQNVNEHCFEACIPKPGSTMSKGEQTCLKQCMEKYMAAWNVVSKQYISRIQREQGAARFNEGIGT